MRAVLDTNVIVAALKSSSGASFELLKRADLGDFEIVISVPLITEYADVVIRPELKIPIAASLIDDILDHICKIGVNQKIHYLWRPFLKDPKMTWFLKLRWLRK